MSSIPSCLHLASQAEAKPKARPQMAERAREREQLSPITRNDQRYSGHSCKSRIRNTGNVLVLHLTHSSQRLSMVSPGFTLTNCSECWTYFHHRYKHCSNTHPSLDSSPKHSKAQLPASFNAFFGARDLFGCDIFASAPHRDWPGHPAGPFGGAASPAERRVPNVRTTSRLELPTAVFGCRRII